MLNIGTFNLLILCMFFVGNASSCFYVTCYRGVDLLYLVITITHKSNIYFYLPNILISHSVLWVHLRGGLYVFFLVVLIKSCSLPGWNTSVSVYVSINPGWVYVVDICVLIIALLTIIVPRVLLMSIYTFFCLFRCIPTHILLFFRWYHIIWWHILEICWVSAVCICIAPVINWRKKLSIYSVINISHRFEITMLSKNFTVVK